MLKKIIILAVLLISLPLIKSPTYAQEGETPESSSTVGSSISLSPEPAEINGNTPSVEITFNGIEDREWHHCSILNEKCSKAKETVNSSGGQLRVTVCAASDKKLRVGKDCDDNSGVYEGNDYFHEGKIYQLTLYEDEEKEIKGPSVRFYVNHYFPDVTVSTNSGPLEVTISGDRRPGPNKNKNRNNYQVVVEGKDKYGNKYKQDKCVTIEQNGGSATAKFGRRDKDDPTPLAEGKYVVKVNERMNEGGIRGKFDPCNGGFTFWHIDAVVNPAGELAPASTCLGTSGQIQTECHKDPNSSDIEGFNKLLEDFGIVSKLALPCSKIQQNGEGKYECVELNTAIGSIPTDPIGFIERLFSIVLTLAGVAALGLLIYGGYNYMISRGDPEKIKGARETITSAIIGLLFIIFSLVILQVIAGDILRIPGFTTP